MNLLFVLENYYPHVGGVESVFKGLAEGLVKQGHKAVVVTHRLKGTAAREKVNGVEIVRVSCFGSRYWFTFLSLFEVFKFASWADIVHTTTYNGALPAWIAARLLKKPVIITVHEVLGKKWKLLSNGFSAFLHNLLEKMILRLPFDKYIGVSHSTARQLAKVVKNRIEVVYNGLDYSFWDARKAKKKIRLGPKGSFVGIFYGRPGMSKGLEVLLRAVPAILDMVPSFRLVALVSRDKAYHKRADFVKSLARALKVDREITFMDPVSRKELPSFLMAADAVIVPSLSEGFGFAVAEACALGKVVVASNVDSIPEVVSGKFVMFEPGNAESLAKAVADAYHGRYKRTKLRRFLLSDNIQNYLKLYSRVLGNEHKDN